MTTSMTAKQNGRLTLALGIALLVMGAAGWAASVRADEPAKELTDEERSNLEKQAKELKQQAFPLYRDVNYTAANELLEKSLEIYRSLKPLPHGRGSSRGGRS